MFGLNCVMHQVVEIYNREENFASNFLNIWILRLLSKKVYSMKTIYREIEIKRKGKKHRDDREHESIVYLVC